MTKIAILGAAGQIAPIIEPNVEAKITPIKVSLVPLTKKPPSVKITSEGIGGKIFSTAIKRIMAI